MGRYDDRDSMIVELYKSGKNIEQIHVEVKASRQVARRVLEEKGLRQRQIQNKRTLEERTNTCEYCGVVYVNTREHANEGNRFCTRECWFAWWKEEGKKNKRKRKHEKEKGKAEKYTRTCEVCGKTYIDSRALTCSEECQRKRYNEKQKQSETYGWTEEKNQKNRERKGIVLHVAECEECGKEFEYYATKENKGYRKYCNKKCTDVMLKRTARAIRRLRINTNTKDRISLVKLINYSRGVCSICGCKVVKTKKSEYKPNGATVDHIIPLAKGGTHTWDNVQLACRDCNSHKSDKMPQQMPLFIGNGEVIYA